MKKSHHKASLICDAQNFAESTPRKTSILLQVEFAPKVRLEHTPGVIKEGDTVIFKCMAKSNPDTVTFQWFVGGFRCRLCLLRMSLHMWEIFWVKWVHILWTEFHIVLAMIIHHWRDTNERLLVNHHQDIAQKFDQELRSRQWIIVNRVIMLALIMAKSNGKEDNETKALAFLLR